MSSDLLRQVASAHEPDRDATSLNSACQWTQTLTPSTHFHQRLLGWLHGIGLLSCGQSVTSNVRFHFQAFHRKRHIHTSEKQLRTSAQNGRGAQGRPKKR